MMVKRDYWIHHFKLLLFYTFDSVECYFKFYIIIEFASGYIIV